jgi:chromosome segregation ATPase
MLIVAGLGVVGGIYAKLALDQRDAASATLQAQVEDLTLANLAFQDEVNNLTAERDQLASQRDQLTADRDQLTGDLSARTNQRDALNEQLSAAQQRASDAQTALAQLRTQLDQARQETTNQQQRATNADARSTAIAAVLQIDEQIQANFIALLTEVGNMQQASDRRDYYGVSSAYSRAQVIANRLTTLVNQRKAALARV